MIKNSKKVINSSETNKVNISKTTKVYTDKQLMMVTGAIFALIFAVSFIISKCVPTGFIHFLYAVVVGALGGHLPSDLSHLALSGKEILYAKCGVFVMSLILSKSFLKFSFINYTSISLKDVERNKKFRRKLFIYGIFMLALYGLAELSKIGMIANILVWLNEVYVSGAMLGTYFMVVVVLLFTMVSTLMAKITGDFATSFYLHFGSLLIKWLFLFYVYRPSFVVIWSRIFTSTKLVGNKAYNSLSAIRKARYALLLKDEKSRTRLILMRFNVQHFNCAGF